MPIPNTETLLPDLLSQYVDSRRADLGLPDAAALPFVIGPTLTEQAFPRVYFVTASFASPHPARMDITVTVELQNKSHNEVPAENALVAALRFALSDKVSFTAWLSALTAEQRTGFRLRKLYLQDGGMAVDDKKGLRGRRTDVVMHVITDELAG